MTPSACLQGFPWTWRGCRSRGLKAHPLLLSAVAVEPQPGGAPVVVAGAPRVAVRPGSGVDLLARARATHTDPTRLRLVGDRDAQGQHPDVVVGLQLVRIQGLAEEHLA